MPEGVWVADGDKEGFIDEELFKHGEILSFDSLSITVKLPTGRVVMITAKGDYLDFEFIAHHEVSKK